MNPSYMFPRQISPCHPWLAKKKQKLDGPNFEFRGFHTHPASPIRTNFACHGEPMLDFCMPNFTLSGASHSASRNPYAVAELLVPLRRVNSKLLSPARHCLIWYGSVSVCPSQVGVAWKPLNKSIYFWQTRYSRRILHCVERNFWYFLK